MFEHFSRTTYRKQCASDYSTIFRINKQSGATERQRWFKGTDIPNSMKRQGWKVEVKRGKRQFKVN